jgi:hypothetical protein
MHLISEHPHTLEDVFNVAHDIEEPTNSDKVKIHIPMLPNLNGDTALHLCNKKGDFKPIDIFLKYLGAYGIDHHSRATCDLLGVFVEKKLPNLDSYLGTRLL